jgi:hypothetical protein
MPENAAESHQSAAPPENEDHPLSGKKLGRNGSILRMADIQAVQSIGDGLHALPSCTVVTDQYDPSIGGAISDPV